MFAEHVTHLLGLIEDVAFRKLDERLAALLLAKGTSFRTTHQTLADELGSTREVISRILEGFEAKGFVRLKRGQIYVLNEVALQEIAGFSD